jgi:periplasmic protein TonB
MAKPILYRPAPRWQFWAFLGGALLVHGMAVVAAIKREPPPVDLSDIPTYTIEASVEQPNEEPTPPPEDIPLTEPPPMPDVPPEFHEEVTPPPKRPMSKVAPVKAPQTAARPSGTMSISQAKAVAINMPRPEYPYEARSRHVMGSGVCVVSVDPSGNVTDATMAQSIGNPILDNSALSAFRRWRFRAGAVPPKVRIPITFTMTGASY